MRIPKRQRQSNNGGNAHTVTKLLRRWTIHEMSTNGRCSADTKEIVDTQNVTNPHRAHVALCPNFEQHDTTTHLHPKNLFAQNCAPLCSTHFPVSGCHKSLQTMSRPCLEEKYSEQTLNQIAPHMRRWVAESLTSCFAGQQALPTYFGSGIRCCCKSEKFFKRQRGLCSQRALFHCRNFRRLSLSPTIVAQKRLGISPEILLFRSCCDHCVKSLRRGLGNRKVELRSDQKTWEPR